MTSDLENESGFTKRDMRMVVRGGVYMIGVLLNDIEGTDMISKSLRKRIKSLGQAILKEVKSFDSIDKVNDHQAREQQP